MLGVTDPVPAAGAFHRVNGGVGTPKCYRTGSHTQARSAFARKLQSLREAVEVGKSWSKTHKPHRVGGRGVFLDEVLGGQAQGRGGRAQVGSRVVNEDSVVA